MIDSAQETLVNGTLYVVATPIGNLADITLRAFAALSRCDLVLAEDTRVTGSLLAAYGISKKLVSLREHNEREMAERVIVWLQEGQCIVQVSDAGTPGISDPGARLAAAVWQAGLKVCPLPGPSAVVTAMSAAGLETGQFQFAGFLPPKSGARKKRMENWLHADYAVICYEAPHRILDCVTDAVAVYGSERRLVLARELTKTFETFIRTTAGELLDIIKQDSNQQRGECVLIIDAAPPQPDSDEVPAAAQQLLSQLVEAMPTKQAAGIVAEFTGISRKKLYDLALEMKKSAIDDEN
ncbi:16S rRNA (cytidine(1402)-2'-O)-methyltransferase [Craterilacuibacter sp.]|uniref:16S rRNA (cytidine(1402)-2'-O)-methyltransferase n=1 Tax=Craterilacuibacter sp. TaxID=2870909 RepID=UPI003F391E52